MDQTGIRDIVYTGDVTDYTNSNDWTIKDGRFMTKWGSSGYIMSDIELTTEAVYFTMRIDHTGITYYVAAPRDWYDQWI